jgi:hypothetical protein
MNKLVKSLAIIAVVVIALGTTSSVFAQTTGPGTRGGYGGGLRNGRGTGGAMFGEPLQAGDDGMLHDYFIAAYAEELDIDAEELETRLAAGETMSEISGMTLEDFKLLMAEVRTEVIAQALADGVITEERAEWLESHGNRMAQGFRANRGGARPNRLGGYGTGECPYNETTP